MLNHLVHEKFTNHQYHELVDKQTGKYEVRSEKSGKTAVHKPGALHQD